MTAEHCFISENCINLKISRRHARTAARTELKIWLTVACIYRFHRHVAPLRPAHLEN